MSELVHKLIKIDERVFVMRGKYKNGRGVVCGKTPDRIRVRFDKKTAGELQGNCCASMLCHIYEPPIAKSEGKADTKAGPKPQKPASPVDEREMNMLWTSPEVQSLGGLLARLEIDPTRSRPLKVCLERAYKASRRSLLKEMESTWENEPSGGGKCKTEPE